MIAEESQISNESNGTCQIEAQQLPIAEDASNVSLIQKEERTQDYGATLDGSSKVQDSELQDHRSRSNSSRKESGKKSQSRRSSRQNSRDKYQDRNQEKKSSRSPTDHKLDSRKKDSQLENSSKKRKDNDKRDRKESSRRDRSESSRNRKDRKQDEKSSRRSTSHRHNDSKSKSKKSSHQSKNSRDYEKKEDRRSNKRTHDSDSNDEDNARLKKKQHSSHRSRERSRRSVSRSEHKKQSSRSSRHSKDEKKKRHSRRSSSSRSHSPSSRSLRHRKDHHRRGRSSSPSRSPKKRLSEAEMRRLDREKRLASGKRLESSKKGSSSHYPKRGEKPGQITNGGKYIIDCNNVKIDSEKNFWDGFCWQPRIQQSGQLDEALLRQTEKQRKIQIQNVPFHLGLDRVDIISYVTNFMKENFLANEGNTMPVLDCEINEADNSANIELSSVEETNIMCKVISFKIFQNDCRVFRLGDNPQGQPSMLALTQQAIRQAEAQAAVIKATESLLSLTAPSTNKCFEESEEKEEVENPYSQVEVYSSVIKVTNTIELGTENNQTDDFWEDLHADLIEEFERYGTIQYHFIIRPFQATVGAKAGTLFIEYETRQSAQHAIGVNQDRLFNNQKLKIYSLPLDSFDKNFRPLISIRK